VIARDRKCNISLAANQGGQLGICQLPHVGEDAAILQHPLKTPNVGK